MWHDIWHEDEIDEINGEIVKWLDKRLKKAEEQ
jgi:chorismate mutase